MDLGTNIKLRRLHLKMSQRELADALGYKSRSAIAKIESGRNEIPLSKLVPLAHALDTSIEQLLDASAHIAQHAAGTHEEKDGPRCVAIVLAGGKSSRNGHAVPTQFLTVYGKPVIMYSLEEYQKHPLISDIYVVCLKGWSDIVDAYASRYLITKLRRIIPAGATGQASIKNALDAIRNDGYLEDDIVVVQETTRPMISSNTISKLIGLCISQGSTVIGEPLNEQLIFQTDSAKKTYIDRTTTFSMQSPDAHRLGTLLEAFEQAERQKVPLDENCCGMLLYRLGYPFNFCEGRQGNIKLVHQEDITVFQALLKHREHTDG